MATYSSTTLVLSSSILEDNLDPFSYILYLLYDTKAV